MRTSIADLMVLSLVLSLGCQPTPSEVTEGSATSTGEPPPASGASTSAVDGTSAETSASGGGSTDALDPSSEGSAGDSTGEPTDEPLGPFGSPVALEVLNSFSAEDDPSLTADMLEIYFASTRTGSEDVWMSTRTSLLDPWDAPVAVDAVNSIQQETFPEVSPDGLVLLVASDRVSLNDLDVYYATRPSRDALWSTPTILTGAATPVTNDWGVTPILDMSRALLCRDETGLGQVDIWEAPIDLDTFVVGTPVLVPELSTMAAECSATMSMSGREAFLETLRPAGRLGWNLFTATREDPADPWETPVEVAELNSDADDVDPWLSPDRRTLYFASNRDVGHFELYVTTRR